MKKPEADCELCGGTGIVTRTHIAGISTVHSYCECTIVCDCGEECLTVEIADVEGVIENEIKQGLSQKQIAQTYALALRSSCPTDWANVNKMIVERWSDSGLERIKKMAWSGSCFPAT